MSMTAAAHADHDPGAEIKLGQVGIANLKRKGLDPEGLAAELRAKVSNAEKLFLRAPVVLDLSHLPELPDIEVVRDLLARIRAAGMLPVGLSYGTSENEQIAQALEVPVIAKFRASYDRAHDAPAEPVARATPPPPSREAPGG
jgi:septum site-determining protein MinC